MRFCLDDGLPARIAEIARQIGLSVVSARELGFGSVHKDQIFVYAQTEGRCIVSQLRFHYDELAERARGRNERHFGVLFITGMPISEHERFAWEIRRFNDEFPDDLPLNSTFERFVPPPA